MPGDKGTSCGDRGPGLSCVILGKYLTFLSWGVAPGYWRARFTWPQGAWAWRGQRGQIGGGHLEQHTGTEGLPHPWSGWDCLDSVFWALPVWFQPALFCPWAVPPHHTQVGFPHWPAPRNRRYSSLRAQAALPAHPATYPLVFLGQCPEHGALEPRMPAAPFVGTCAVCSLLGMFLYLNYFF